MGNKSNDEEIDSKEFGKLQGEVHSLTTGFKRLENTIIKIFDKMETHEERTAPKPLSVGMILAGIVASLTILAILFGSVVWTIPSMNRPIVAQVDQISKAQTTQSTLMMQNASLIQLTNKEISVIKNKTNANESSLHYILFEKQLFSTLKEFEKDIERLQMQMNRIVDSAHHRKGVR